MDQGLSNNTNPKPSNWVGEGRLRGLGDLNMALVILFGFVCFWLGLGCPLKMSFLSPFAGCFV
jgi:hypothetical protein